MVSQPHRSVTPEEYLALERRAETRSEYLDGVIVAMAGGSGDHNLIMFNLVREVSIQLRGRPCRGYANDLQARIPARNIYTYPDIAIVRGESQFEPGGRNILLNPALIIEVLSDSTERYNRGKKFAYYRSLPSLRDDVLVAQDEYRIDCYRRDPDGRWIIGEAHRLDANLALATGDCVLNLAAIYAGIDLPD